MIERESYNLTTDFNLEEDIDDDEISETLSHNDMMPIKKHSNKSNIF